jgi:hypothetical protein
MDVMQVNNIISYSMVPDFVYEYPGSLLYGESTVILVGYRTCVAKKIPAVPTHR